MARVLSACPQHSQKGATLVDTLIAISLMVIVFVSIAGAFEVEVDTISNNKARAGAIALANERMEYIRSLAYPAIGTVGGVPSGTMAQSETVALSGVTYVRRTYVAYADDPKDGLDAADENGIPEDYKAVKVDVSWTTRTGARDISLVGRFTPTNGLETNPCGSPCGVLSVAVVDATGAPLPNASVAITNASTSPPIAINTFSNASGTARVLGAPAATDYGVVVTDAGYSTAQTYDVSAQNTNPAPGKFTVAEDQTTSATFAIDRLGSIALNTLTQIVPGTWTDDLDDDSNIATSSNVAIQGGAAQLSTGATSGEMQSVVSPAWIKKWGTFTADATLPSGTSIVYRFYNSSGLALVPDSELPGNSAGFTASSVDLSSLSTTTYPSLRLDATLSGAGDTPLLNSWSLGYRAGGQPIPNVALELKGVKTIGSGPSGTLYKYDNTTLTTDASGAALLPNMEWDSYTASMHNSTYDIASSCPLPQPLALPPGGTVSSALYLAAHTANSLLVDVRAAGTGTLLSNAYVEILSGGTPVAGNASDTCGQAFFPGLSTSQYDISVGAPGFATTTVSAFNISGRTQLSVQLN